MKTNIENGIYISHDGTLYSVQDWADRLDCTSADSIVLITDHCSIEIAKEDLPGEFNFEDAQKAAALYREGFRCPTRHEAIEMYDAQFRGLDEAFQKIGGKPVTSVGWLSEADPDPEYNSNGAFFYYGYMGYVNSNGKYSTYAVRPVRTFKKVEI